MPASYEEALKLWNGKPYLSLNCYLQQTFGEKIYKIALDGGFTCPNRDGTLDSRGCIFCSAGGSGDFAGDRRMSISDQIESGKQLLSGKRTGQRFIAYFQAFTNTYAPVEHLRSLYVEAALHPDIAALSIATRPDCLPPEVLRLLLEIQQIKPVWVELGLQTIHKATAARIRRGYALDVFTDAAARLHTAGIPVIVHTILGLPGETTEDILETHRLIAKLPVDGIKLQLLHVLKQTDLGRLYEKTPFKILTPDEYVDLVIRCIEVLPPNMVIHRITGDGPKDLLIAPEWSTHKKQVLNKIHHEFKNRRTWQGALYTP